MAKRPAVDVIDEHRDIKRIRLDISEVKEKKEALEKICNVLQKELDNHPEEKKRVEESNNAYHDKQLHKFLPDYLYNLLVVQGIGKYGRLIEARLCSDFSDGNHLNERSYDVTFEFEEMSFFSGSIEVDTEDGDQEITHAGIRIPHYMLTLKSSLAAAGSSEIPTKLQALWENSMQFNKEDPTRALTGLVLWAMNQARDRIDYKLDEFNPFYDLGDVGKELRKLQGKSATDGKATCALAVPISSSSEDKEPDSDESGDASKSGEESVFYLNG